MRLFFLARSRRPRQRFGQAREQAAPVGAADRGFDVVVNYTGGDTWVKSLKVLKVGGRLLTCGATAGYAPQEDIRFIWTFELKVLGSNGWARSDIATLLDLVQQGKLKVLVDKIFPLKEAREALRVIEDREVLGKIVVAP